jgi:DNA primase
MTESMVDFEPIVEMLIDILGEYKYHNERAGQIAFSCPVCSYEIKGLDHLDGKGNLEVNYLQGVYKCWSCAETHDTHGSLHKLVRKYGTHRQLKKFELMMPESEFEIEKKTYQKVKLPKEFISFKTASNGLKLTHHYKRAHNYLKERNITDEMIDRFNMGFCYEGKYANRIIIPSYDDEGIINYFVARSYESRPYRKYDNPEAEKQAIIFNEYLIDWNEPIHIVEGPFDSIFVPNAIPMLGKVMSDLLFDKIYNNAKKVIIVLDGDAFKDAEKLYYRLNGGKLFGKIWITRLPIDRDIADLQGDLTNYQPFQID